jgi:hypothetical protein
MKGMKAMVIKNKLWIFGSVQHLTGFVEENYVEDPYHHDDGNGHPKIFLHFSRISPVPTLRLNDDKDLIAEWKRKNWGTDIIYDKHENVLIVYYKHDYDYSTYKLSYDNNLFNFYSIGKLNESTDTIYNDNMNPDENELITTFYTNNSAPLGVFKKWIERYQFTTMKLRLDYWDCENDEFVGRVYYNYEHNMYVYEHYTKEDNPIGYIHYMLKENLRTIDDYAKQIVGRMIKKNPKLKDIDFNDLFESVLDIIEDEKNVELIDVAKSIYQMLTDLE